MLGLTSGQQSARAGDGRFFARADRRIGADHPLVDNFDCFPPAFLRDIGYFTGASSIPPTTTLWVAHYRNVPFPCAAYLRASRRLQPAARRATQGLPPIRGTGGQGDVGVDLRRRLHRCCLLVQSV